MRTRYLLIFLGLAVTSPARAGIIAHYRTPDGVTVIEVDEQGQARISGKGPNYRLLTSTGDFFVFGEKFVAARTEDLEASTNSRRSQSNILNILDRLARMKGESPVSERPPPPAVHLVRAGTATVAGIGGDKYRAKSGDMARDSWDIVISTAADLQPLGRVWSKIWPMPQQESGYMSFMNSLGSEVAALLRSGTLLKYSKQLVLTGVSLTEVPPERFRVPTTQLSREQVDQLVDASRPNNPAENSGAKSRKPPR